MKTSEAKEIVGQIVQWQLALQGIVEPDNIPITVDLSKYSLEDLIKANKLVSANNKRKQKLQQYWLAKNGKSKGISISMTIADRLIAGVYCALNFPVSQEVHVLINGIGVGCLRVKYEE